MSTEISTSLKVDKEARIDFESSFNITDGEELMDKLEAKHNFFPTFGNITNHNSTVFMPAPLFTCKAKFALKISYNSVIALSELQARESKN